MGRHTDQRRRCGRTVIGALCVLAGVWAGVAGPPVPETPAAVDGLLYARSFTVEAGFPFHWRKERPIVTEGLILVLDVDPALVFPRESAEPVLYVGDHTAQRISRGHPAGRLVALVPGNLDLADAPIWFGAPELPERVDLVLARRERARADAAGIRPFSADTVSAALGRGGERLRVRDQRELATELARVFEHYVAPLLPADVSR